VHYSNPLDEQFPKAALSRDAWVSGLTGRLLVVTPGCAVFEPWLDDICNLALDYTGRAPIQHILPGGALGLYPAPTTMLNRLVMDYRRVHNQTVGRQLAELATTIDDQEIDGGVLILSHATRCPELAGRFHGRPLHCDPANEARVVNFVTEGAGLAVMAWNNANALYDLPVWTVALRTSTDDEVCQAEFRPVPLLGRNDSLDPLAELAAGQLAVARA
jgi:hypothetical protein